MVKRGQDWQKGHHDVSKLADETERESTFSQRRSLVVGEALSRERGSVVLGCSSWGNFAFLCPKDSRE